MGEDVNLMEQTPQKTVERMLSASGEPPYFWEDDPDCVLLSEDDIRDGLMYVLRLIKENTQSGETPDMTPLQMYINGSWNYYNHNWFKDDD